MGAAVRARFETSRHHVLSTLRTDGSPRVSGTEVQFHGPDLTIGSMPGSMKARDLRRDPRYALHANPGDGSMDGGDAKLAGRAVEVLDPDELAAYADAVEQLPPGPFHLFRLEVAEAVLTSVDPSGEFLVIQLWQRGAAVKRFERR